MNPFMKYNKNEDELEWPKNLPYKDCLDYFISQNITRTKVPLPDTRVEAPTEVFVLNRIIFDDTNRRLTEKRNEYNSKRKGLQEQWVDIEEREKLLQESFIKFNKFVVQNTIKGERSAAAYLPNKLAAEARALEVEQIRQRLERIRVSVNTLNDLLRKYGIYEALLKIVCEYDNSHFKTVAQVIERYEVLAAQRVEIIKNDKQILEDLEKQKNKLKDMKEYYEKTIIKLRYALGLLEGRYETIKVRSLQIEGKLETIKSNILDYEQMIDATKLGVWQLYVAICTTVNEKPKLPKGNWENVLIHIKKHIGRVKIIRLQTQAEKLRRKSRTLSIFK